MARQRLYSIYEIAQRYGISKGTAGYYSRRPDFPEPLDTLSTGRVWVAEEVEQFFRDRAERERAKLDRMLGED